MHFRNDPVAADTVCCVTPEIDDGSASDQIFVRKDTLLTEVCKMKSDKQFSNILSDSIYKHGSICKLIINREQVEIRKKLSAHFAPY